MSRELTIRFPTRTTPQAVVNLWRSTAKYIKGKSGWGGGKTFAMVHWALKMAALNPGLRGILVEPTAGMVSDILIPTIEEVCGTHRIPFEIPKPNGRPNWIIPDLGFTWYLRSGEKPHRLVGPTLCASGIDEAGLQKFDVFKKVSGRVRDKKASFLQLAHFGTPDEMNWFYNLWVEKKGDPEWAEFAWTTYDNAANLAPGYIEGLRSTLDELHFRAFVMGEDLHLASGIVFSNFTDANIVRGTKAETGSKTHRIPPEAIHWTMDFNVNPMTAVAWVVRGERTTAFDEVVLRHSHVEETVVEMKRRYPFKTFPIQHCLPDATGSGRSSVTGYTHHDVLKQAGYRLQYRHLRREADAINSARRLICDANGERRMFIDEKCTKLITSVRTWAYEKDSMRTREKEYANDDRLYFVPHLADNVKYLAWNLFPVSKPSWRIG